MYRIYIVEDDEVISAAVCAHLKSWGLEAYAAADFSRIEEEFAELQPHLVLMDISLPLYNGFYHCTEIRKLSDVPIVFLSSASDNMNIITAMNAGADDFIAKPFDLPVLLAKVQAILRRAYNLGARSSLIEHNGLIYSIGDGTVSYRGVSAELTKNESRILSVLLEHRGEIVPRSELMNRLWETDCFVDENTLTVNVTRLRRRLEEIGAENVIKTRKGIGYIIE